MDRVKVIITGTILLMGLMVSMLLISRGMAKNFVLDGVYFGGIDLTGRGYDEVGVLIEDSYSKYSDRKIDVVLNGQSRQITLSNLGVEFDSEETLQRVYDLSYGDSLFRHLQTRAYGMLGRAVRVKPVYEIDRSKFVKSLNIIFPEIKSPRNAQVLFAVDGVIDVAGHVDGVAVDFDATYRAMNEDMGAMDLDEVELKNRLLMADYTTNDAQRDAHLYRWFLGQKVRFVNADLEYKHEISFPREWLNIDKGEVNFDLNLIRRYLAEIVAADINIVKSDLEVLSLPEEGVGYAELIGEVRDGREVNVSSTLNMLIEAFENDDFEVAIEVMNTTGKIVNRTDKDLGKMDLVAQGRSNFRGSDSGRAFNVRRGLSEKMNNILIQPGATFSFNSFLGGPVTYSNGWKGALAIFNGKDLEVVAGGGLCQVSTTVYRAALNAGLEIVEKRNHSLYVHYYREYGNGLDATIYPGQQDLKFTNNTGNYILMSARTEGDDAFVDFYGTSDGRKIELVGPIYKNEIPEGYHDQISLGYNQIAWIYKIVWPDGNKEERILKASYRNAIQR